MTRQLTSEEIHMRLRNLLLALCATSLLATSCTLIRGSSSPVIDRIRETHKIRVGTAGDYPPLTARTASGGVIGLDADLALALALILDVELELIVKPFHELLPAVQSHEIDLAISGITMSPQRNMNVMFAGPYFVSTKAILGSAEKLEGITSVADLDTKADSVAALNGGTSQTLAKIALAGPKLVWVDTIDEGIEMVRRGTVDALIADSPIARFALVRYPNDGLASVEIRNSEDPVGIALAVDDAVFLNLVQNYLANLEEIDLLPKLREHWFEGDSSWLRYLAE
jgi:polar amino acid transport system substrate-binding protein